MLMQRLSICGVYGISLLAPIVAQAAPPTLYALSQRGGGSEEEVLSYDLTQDFVSTGGYLASTIAPLNTSGLGPSLISIAVSGNTLYALSQRGGGSDEEVLSYDLTQDFVSTGGYLASTIAPLNTSGLGPSLTSIAVSGGGSATAVPEPSSYALGMIGFLTLAAIRGLRLRSAERVSRTA
jgi:hypothetical protein